MFQKRKFVKEFCRDVDGEKMYTITDDSGSEVFVDRIFNEKDSQAVLYLVEQAYDIGVKDMSASIEETIKVANKMRR